MIIKSLGDHKDAKVAKGAKQAAKKFIRGRVGKITLKKPRHCYEKKLLNKHHINTPNYLRRRKRPLKKKVRRFSAREKNPKHISSKIGDTGI